jgi:CRP-like cAMP-binding protein
MSMNDAIGAHPQYFAYPSNAGSAPDAEPAFLAGATDEQWNALLDAMDVVRFAPGDVVVAAGGADRALYLLVDGRVRATTGEIAAAPATLGAVALLTGRPRTQALRAETHGEALRLDREALDTLAARDPHLGRAVLTDVARLVAQRLLDTAGPRAEWMV